MVKKDQNTTQIISPIQIIPPKLEPKSINTIWVSFSIVQIQNQKMKNVLTSDSEEHQTWIEAEEFGVFTSKTAAR